MAAATNRLEIQVDVLENADQRALPLAQLKPPELVQAILQEFRDIEHLGVEGAAYTLVNMTDGTELDPDVEIGAQLADGAHLRLVERDATIPAGVQPPPDDLYLREHGGGWVYKINWLPAVVGRADSTLPDSRLVAADLSNLPTGLRISRRHLLLTWEGGRYFVECASGNPAEIRRPDGSSVALGSVRQSIAAGDVLYLNRSDVSLKFIVRAAGAASA